MSGDSPAASPGWRRPGLGFALGAASGAALVAALGRGPTPSAPAAPPALESAARAAASPAPSRAPVPPAPPASLDPLALAASGDLDAIKQLEAGSEPGRTAAEALAIASGRAALARGDLAQLSRAIEADPPLAHDRATLARLHGFIEREAIPLDALAAVGRLPGPESTDLLHSVWRRHRHTTTGLLARDLLRREQALAQASDALQAAVELERLLEARPASDEQLARRCDRAREATLRVSLVGDRRCLPLLAELAVTTGCGGDGRGDCYGCLRGTEVLAAAKLGASQREAKTPWLLPGRRP